PTAEDEGLTTGVEGRGMDDKRYGLEEDEKAVPGGQQQAASVIGTTVSAPLGLGYGALRR
ncbi:hypothetical protein Tco_0571968, partial [Tanacetum coccineum]